jgi:hypothetical protein
VFEHRRFRTPTPERPAARRRGVGHPGRDATHPVGGVRQVPGPAVAVQAAARPQVPPAGGLAAPPTTRNRGTSPLHTINLIAALPVCGALCGYACGGGAPRTRAGRGSAVKIERCVAHDQCTRHRELADLLGHDRYGYLILRAVTHAGITTRGALAEANPHAVRGLGPKRIAYVRRRVEADPGTR